MKAARAALNIIKKESHMKTLIVGILALVLCTASLSTCQAQEFKKAGDVANLTTFVALSVTFVKDNEILTLRARQNRESMFQSNMKDKTIASIQSNTKIERWTSEMLKLNQTQLDSLNRSFAELQINTIANYDKTVDLKDEKGRVVILIVVRTADQNCFGYVKALNDLGNDETRVRNFIKSVLEVSSQFSREY